MFYLLGVGPLRAGRIFVRTGFMAACALALVAGPAQAGLGEPVASVARDQSALNGQAYSVTQQGRFSLHEFTTADGVHVREFVSLSGTVFAVAWSGPDIPDLKVLLGSYHADYLAATETPQANRRAVVVNNERVVMRMNALPRGFIGGAHLPGQLPAGVSSQELR